MSVIGEAGNISTDLYYRSLPRNLVLECKIWHNEYLLNNKLQYHGDLSQVTDMFL